MSLWYLYAYGTILGVQLFSYFGIMLCFSAFAFVLFIITAMERVLDIVTNACCGKMHGSAIIVHYLTGKPESVAACMINVPGNLNGRKGIYNNIILVLNQMITRSMTINLSPKLWQPNEQKGLVRSY